MIDKSEQEQKQEEINQNADVDRRGDRSDAFDRAQQQLDQRIVELQGLLEARTIKGGLTSIDVQCDSIDDEPMIGTEAWGSYKHHESANVSFLRAHREHTRGKSNNSGKIEFMSQEDCVMWHVAEIPVGPERDDKMPRETKPAVCRWSFDDSRYEYNANNEVAVWPDFDDEGKPHKTAGQPVVMWRLQEIRKIQDDAVSELASAMVDVRRAQSKVRKERKADFDTSSVDKPGDTSGVSF